MSGPGPQAAVRSRWIARQRPVENPLLRVICFPHVGAGAAVFNPWLDLMPSGAELCAIRLPGRENRNREPLVDDWRALFDSLEPELAPLLDRPFMVLGHSSGSVLAYEFARRLHAAGGPVPAMVVLSSAPAPSARFIDDPLHLLPRSELIRRVIAYGGMTEAVLADPALMEIFEPILRADYSVIERLEYSPGPPLDTPITVIGGRHDTFVDFPSLAAWREESTREFSLHLIDAGHYILAEAGPLVGDLARRLVERERDGDR